MIFFSKKIFSAITSLLVNAFCRLSNVILLSSRRAIILWKSQHNIDDKLIGLNWERIVGCLHLGINVVMPFLNIDGAVDVYR